MQKKILLTCVALCALASGKASAASFDFYKLKSPTQAGDFPAIDGVISQGGDVGRSDVVNSGVSNWRFAFVNTPDAGGALALFGLGLAGLATSRRRLA